MSGPTFGFERAQWKAAAAVVGCCARGLLADLHAWAGPDGSATRAAVREGGGWSPDGFAAALAELESAGLAVADGRRVRVCSAAPAAPPAALLPATRAAASPAVLPFAGGGPYRLPAGFAEEFAASWNALPADSRKAVRAMNRGRVDQLRRRMQDATWRENWREALAAVPSSPFCRGENRRGWTANVDWFLRPGTVLKLVEGQYDGDGPGERSGGATGVESAAFLNGLGRRGAA